MILIAVFNLCRYIRLASRFLHDMFAFFVCTIYIHDGIAGLIGLWPDAAKQVGDRAYWQDDNCDGPACWYFSFILFSITLFGALFFNAVTSTRLVNEAGRELIKDYALTIAVFLAIFVGYASQPAQDWAHPENNTQYIPHITLPSTVRPTFNGIDSHNYTERKWFVGLSLAPRSFAGEFNTTEQFDKPGCVRACGVHG